MLKTNKKPNQLCCQLRAFAFAFAFAFEPPQFAVSCIREPSYFDSVDCFPPQPKFLSSVRRYLVGIIT